jgi:hypothetical protein
MAAQATRPKVAAMLASVTLFGAMVRCLWKNCGKPVEKKAALWLEGLRLLRKSPKEAKEVETRGSLDLLR